ncbi:MAG: carbonate dehydratase [Burkholderiaceae bacterium]
MLRKNPRGDYPVVHETAFVDPTAILCGLVTVGANSNIQDGVVIHSKDGAAVTVGEFTSIAHRSIVHGPCVVGNHVFIGFNSVLFNCKVADDAVVRHNCVVDGRDIPQGFYLPSATLVNENTDLSALDVTPQSAREFSESVITTNVSLAEAYRRIQNEF